MREAFSIGILTVLLPLAAPSFGQAPFSVIDLHFHWTQDVSQWPLHQHWQPGRGAEFGLTMPFYAGDFEIGGTVHRYAARSDVPGFAALWVYAGWGGHLSWGDNLSVFATGRLGNYFMSFDDAEETYAGTAAESELALGAGAGLSLRVAGPVWVYGRIDHVRVMTLPAMQLWYASGGVRVRVRAGEGWQAFFR